MGEFQRSKEMGEQGEQAPACCIEHDESPDCTPDDLLRMQNARPKEAVSVAHF